MKKIIYTIIMLIFATVSAKALVYSVTVPQGTKSCFIAGEMNGWKQQPMTRIDDTHYTVLIPIANSEHKYKYCSGPVWGYVETAADGSDVENRSYSPSDVVLAWAAIYDKNVPDINLVYQVKVPPGTKHCYISGGWNGWLAFNEMEKIDATHYKASILSNRALKYLYYAGPGFGYAETDSNHKPLRNNRSYSANDEVKGWQSVYDKAVPDEQLTYYVTVPEGTHFCYIAGGWDNWQVFKKMDKIDAKHFKITLKSNKALKYIYLSGPDWKYAETNANMKPTKARNYALKDAVLKWKSVCINDK